MKLLGSSLTPRPLWRCPEGCQVPNRLFIAKISEIVPEQVGSSSFLPIWWRTSFCLVAEVENVRNGWRQPRHLEIAPPQYKPPWLGSFSRSKSTLEMEHFAAQALELPAVPHPFTALNILCKHTTCGYRCMCLHNVVAHSAYSAFIKSL